MHHSCRQMFRESGFPETAVSPAIIWTCFALNQMVVNIEDISIDSIQFNRTGWWKVRQKILNRLNISERFQSAAVRYAFSMLSAAVRYTFSMQSAAVRYAFCMQSAAMRYAFCFHRVCKLMLLFYWNGRFSFKVSSSERKLNDSISS